MVELLVLTNCIDNDNSSIISGLTYSMSGISTSGAHKTAFNNQPTQYDAFIAKFNENGNRIWATYYYGGDMQEEIYEVDVMLKYLFCWKSIQRGISSHGSYQTEKKKGENDIFLKFFTKWKSNLKCFGGENYDDLSSIKLVQLILFMFQEKLLADQYPQLQILF
jgi:hypothetical protein